MITVLKNDITLTFARRCVEEEIDFRNFDICFNDEEDAFTITDKDYPKYFFKVTKPAGYRAEYQPGLDSLKVEKSSKLRISERIYGALGKRTVTREKFT